MELSQDFKSLQESVQKSLVSTVKTANRIAAEDLSFQRTINPDVAQQLDDKSARILDLSTRLLQSAARACGIKAPKLEDAEDIDINWRGVVDVVDSVLEKADTAMDEYTGLVKRKEPPTADSAQKPKKPKSTNKVIRYANIQKPQGNFEKQPDNFPTGPWKPILTAKPHATVTLEKSLVTAINEHGAPQYKHPYESEILNMKYPTKVYQSADPQIYQPVEGTQATWVDTYEGVLEMLEELKKAKEIAVDLEHHDYRTYVGLVSLMQVSTRDKDWIVDTLQPWRHKLEVLNEVFADPSIVKVFHGAYMDMVWLQRDLGLYVNGLFDTFFACELLYSGRSLAFLLSKFVDFDADKQYQLADWRIRPIPEEMLYYARSDTHYLLYIYDRVRNDLVAASDSATTEPAYIDRALQKSRDLSLSRHEHPSYKETTGEGSRGWYNYVFKHSHLAFSSEQFSVFKALWKWRDTTARTQDESPNYVLSTHTITEIARINPPDAKALHSLLPLSAPLARSRFDEMWTQAKQAKFVGGPSLLHFFTSMAPDAMRKSGLPIVARKPARLPDLDGDVTVTRLTRSQLFGDMPISTLWEASKPVSDNLDDKIPFPWQRFVQQATFEGDVHDDEAADATLPIDDEPVAVAAETDNAEPEEEADQEFTLRRGQKRKSEVLEEENSPSSDDEAELDSDEEMQDGSNGLISLVDDEPRKKSKKELKAERKAERKEKRTKEEEVRKGRKARKTQQKLEQKAKQKDDKEKKYDAVPFDYSQASSVMNAARDPSEAQQRRKKRVFDPYSKTGEEPLKGARKAPPVKGERSATFKK
ncbi:hypothetical protein G7046_g7177 [Stylonectria norvegica]|nr:hypothetical protein G7046_g7177 [Stylonectria norvegica]